MSMFFVGDTWLSESAWCSPFLFPFNTGINFVINLIDNDWQLQALLFAAGCKRRRRDIPKRVSVTCYLLNTVTNHKMQISVQNKFFVDAKTHEIHKNLQPLKINTHTVPYFMPHSHIAPYTVNWRQRQHG